MNKLKTKPNLHRACVPVMKLIVESSGNGVLREAVHGCYLQQLIGAMFVKSKPGDKSRVIHTAEGLAWYRKLTDAGKKKKNSPTYGQIQKLRPENFRIIDAAENKKFDVFDNWQPKQNASDAGESDIQTSSKLKVFPHQKVIIDSFFNGGFAFIDESHHCKADEYNGKTIDGECEEVRQPAMLGDGKVNVRKLINYVDKLVKPILDD